jgi:hypothetical protein
MFIAWAEQLYVLLALFQRGCFETACSRVADEAKLSGNKT